uniref:Uncharacterized protein LOC113799118 n=1 Tax=Dermatophagoides pteronyssinus TaxID=6956 RepID=A0A6P6YJS1_DERPT
MTLMHTYFCIEYYLNDRLRLIPILLDIPMFAITCNQISYLLGHLFLSINFQLFIIEFFKSQLKQLLQLSKSLLLLFYKQQRRRRRNYLVEELFWKNFQTKYIKLFCETKHFNQTFSIVLFYLEIISKLSILLATIFFSKQKQMSLYNTTALISLMSLFCYTTFLYVRISNIPTFNHQCSKILTYLIIKRSKLLYYPYRQYQWKQTIHYNLFIQTIMNNQFGFTCGQLFFINKYKYIEILMINLPIILLFY